MSYVAVSSQFTSDVRGKLREMRRRELTGTQQIEYKLSGTRTDLLAWAWGEHLHLKEAIPGNWCKVVENINLRFETGERGLFRASAALSPPLLVPPTGLPGGTFPIKPTDPDIAANVARDEQIYDINERWNKVDKQILEFLGKCKSVNEALKLWPQIEMYLPPSYVERVNEKKERVKGGQSEAAEALKNLDTDHLTTAAVISRMSGE